MYLSVSGHHRQMDSMTGMDDHGSGSAEMSGMPPMLMYLHFILNDAVLFKTWTPSQPWQYALTWLFIFALAIGARALHVASAWLEARARLRQAEMDALVRSHHQDLSTDDSTAKESLSRDQSLSPALSRTPMAHRHEAPIGGGGSGVAPFRLSIDLPRGAMYFCTSFLSYILMLIIMNFNIGYLFAIVGGLGVGEVIFGRYSAYWCSIR